jgi:isocitrate dehydrogenase
MTSAEPTYRERGAETIRMPEGNGFAIAICDDEYPDRIVRKVWLMAVDADDADTILHEHTEVIWRAANPA